MANSVPVEEIRQVPLPFVDEAWEDLYRADSLQRTRYGRQLGNEFDRQWITGFHLWRDGALHGEIRYEAARLFTLLPTDDTEWQHYRFGAIVEFPLVAGPDPELCRRWQLGLLAKAREHAGRLYPGMRLFCFLRRGDAGAAAVLEASGFVRSKDLCIDGKLLKERGLPSDCGPAIVYRFDPAATDGPPVLFDPLALLTRNDEFLRIFSNQETKIRLVPTWEFWSAVKPYTTFSAYPLIRSLLRKFLARIALTAPPRVLVAPCAAGDFLRFWPPEQPLAGAVAVDIREDCLRLARLRLELPQLDRLNLALAQVLSEIVKKGGITEEAREQLTEVSRLLQEGRGGASGGDFWSEPALHLFARCFDEVLRNRAVPDWYFPIKILAGSLGLPDSVSTDALVPWLAARGRALTEAARRLDPGPLFQAAFDLREAGRSGMASELCQLYEADLTRPETLREGKFDVVLCWEFIHVFHAPAELERFLSLLVSRTAEGGAILITCIRELEATEPQELRWAREFFSRQGLAAEVVQMSFQDEEVPFARRLRYYYPALIVSV